MGWEDVRLWGLYVIFGVQLFLQLMALISRRHLATQSQIGTLEEKIRIERGRIHDTNSRVGLLEQKVGLLPSHDDITKLTSEISKLNTSTATLSAKVEGFENNLESLGGSITRQEENLMKIAMNGMRAQ